MSLSACVACGRSGYIGKWSGTIKQSCKTIISWCTIAITTATAQREKHSCWTILKVVNIYIYIIHLYIYILIVHIYICFCVRSRAALSKLSKSLSVLQQPILPLKSVYIFFCKFFIPFPPLLLLLLLLFIVAAAALQSQLIAAIESKQKLIFEKRKSNCHKRQNLLVLTGYHRWKINKQANKQIKRQRNKPKPGCDLELSRKRAFTKIRKWLEAMVKHTPDYTERKIAGAFGAGALTKQIAKKYCYWQRFFLGQRISLTWMYGPSK